MLKQFKTLADLCNKFSDNQVALDHFKAIRWRDGEFCPYCGHDKVYTLKANRYQCAQCRNTFSILVGTIFENTKLPLKVWFGAMWLIDQSPEGGCLNHAGEGFRYHAKKRVVCFASPSLRGAHAIVQHTANDRKSRN